MNQHNLFTGGEYKSRINYHLIKHAARAGEYAHKDNPPPNIQTQHLRLYDCIKQRVNEIISFINPQKTVFLAIDGVAPKAKQNQQRQRRFRTEKLTNFDSNCITSGTIFMKQLCNNLTTTEWLQTDAKTILSTDNQGEHKLIYWIRKNKNKNDYFCIMGADADLILLSCLLEKQNIYILREFNSPRMRTAATYIKYAKWS